MNAMREAREVPSGAAVDQPNAAGWATSGGCLAVVRGPAALRLDSWARGSDLPGAGSLRRGAAGAKEFPLARVGGAALQPEVRGEREGDGGSEGAGGPAEESAEGS